jgi:carbon monoxide dehydrogenase subunit G
LKIQNEIEIAAPPDELFDVLADPERVAPLFPGATLEATEDDDTYAGAVKLKIGPITASYQGTLRFVELDHENHRAVMEASGQETNGQGNAQATVTASVSGSNAQSVLKLDTDLEVRGKAAQFGRGALGNVSQRILDQFARNLESQVLSSGEQEKDAGEQGQKPPSEENASTTRAEASKESASARPTAAAPAGEESLDVLSVVGLPMLRRAAPAVAGLALGLLIGNLVASRKTLRAYQEAMRLMSYGQLYGPPNNRWWRRPRG